MLTTYLNKLLQNISVLEPVVPNSIVVKGLAVNSQKVKPGYLFFAIEGYTKDGNQFIQEAIQKGACAVITEKKDAFWCATVPLIHVTAIRMVLAQVARRFYDFPDKSLALIGVTGTNGKSTVTHLIQFLMQTLQPVGLIGTLGYKAGNYFKTTTQTTPEPIELFELLHTTKDLGAKHAILEVTAHAIDQKRVYGLTFDTAVFLNLTQDHLDTYHTLDTYFNAKKSFFTGATGSLPKHIVIGIDDLYGQQLFKMVSASVPVITFGFTKNADIQARNIKSTLEGSVFDLFVHNQFVSSIQLPLIGNFNILNALAAVAVAVVSQYNNDYSVVCSAIKEFPQLSGRLQPVKQGQPFSVFTDYAHTEDALSCTLRALRPLTKGVLGVIFGCGGDRDRSKRSKMVTAVQKEADYAWATADNPRTEPLSQIFQDMKKGVSVKEKITFIECRKTAIHQALSQAKAGDVILIAGKGHERYQQCGLKYLPFDDFEIASDYLRSLY